MPPREVATALAARLREIRGIAAVDIAGPGFLNITLEAASAGELARAIVEAGAAYGASASESGRVINLEYISAMVRLLRTAGADVTAEYYINDAGAQADKLGGSVLAVLNGTPTPEGGYQGEYVDALAAQVQAARPEITTLPHDEAIAAAWSIAYPAQLAAIKETLDRFHVHFDVWFSETALHEAGAVQDAVARLRAQGHVFDRDGAIWLRTTDFGDDKDRVLIRANGVPTYFAADAAYYLSKKDRGFDEKIYLLGADHHGYIGRLKAIAACAGDDPEHNIEVKIGQLVAIGGERMGKRRGNALYLDDLLEWIGSDALRYSLARYPADSPLSLDGEELRRQTNDNPVFYVQYAHARTANVARLAAEDGVHRVDGFPRVIAQAAHLLEPHRVARYLEDLAGRFHKWYDTCRVRPMSAEEEVTDLHRTRLWLNDATRQVLANGLELLGVSAPERM
jgi:arginyl-tRNA synthetase